MQNVEGKKIIEYLTTLGLSTTAPLTVDILKQSYRKLAKYFHPDNKETGDEAKFKKIQEAYDYCNDNLDYVNKQISSKFSDNISSNTISQEEFTFKMNSITILAYLKIFNMPFDMPLNRIELRKHYNGLLDFYTYILQNSKGVQELKLMYNYLVENELMVDEYIASRFVFSVYKAKKEREADLQKEKQEKEARERFEKEKQERERKEKEANEKRRLEEEKKQKEAEYKAKKEKEAADGQLLYINLLDEEISKIIFSNYSDDNANLIRAIIEGFKRTSIKIDSVVSAKQTINLFKSKIAKIKTIKETERLKTRLKAGLISLLFVILLSVSYIIIHFTVIIPLNKYNNAIMEFDNGNFNQAEVIFKELNDYKDAKKYLVAVDCKKLKSTKLSNATIKELISYAEQNNLKIKFDYDINGASLKNHYRYNFYEVAEKDGYLFDGWYNLKVSFDSKAFTINLLLTPVFKAITYKIIYDLEGGNNNPLNPNGYTADMQNIVLYAPSKVGYTFDGWFCNEELISSIDTSNMCDINVKAKWVYYTVSTKTNIDKAGDISLYNYTKITVNDDVVLTANPNTGYEFIGWFDGDTLLTRNSSYSFKMKAENLNYEARFELLKFEISIVNQNDDVVISGINNNKKHDFLSNVALTANVPKGCVLEWVRSDGVEHIGNDYNFTVPAQDIKILVHILYIYDNGKLYFGSYPQTLLQDESKITKLNKIAGYLPTKTNNYSWTDYKFYDSGSIFYQDIDENNDGLFDYRGVYFIKYKPNYYSSSSSDESYQPNNGYNVNKTYWFKYEMIEWNVLESNSNELLVLSNLLLDSQHIYPSIATYEFTHYGGKGYACDYALSYIRDWLNNDFYNTAFSNLQKKIIKLSFVDNGNNSLMNEKNQDTEDKLFLLSRDEVEKYFPSDYSKYAKGTDYAKCQGLYVRNENSYWWTRTALSVDYAYIISAFDGKIYNEYVNVTYSGVRVACWVSINT